MNNVVTVRQELQAHLAQVLGEMFCPEMLHLMAIHLTRIYEAAYVIADELHPSDWNHAEAHGAAWRYATEPASVRFVVRMAAPENLHLDLQYTS